MLSAFQQPLYLTPSSVSRKTHICRVVLKEASIKMTTASKPTDGTTLFIKAGPDGGIGDCPFSQKANLALQFRKAEYDMHTVDLSNKPDWFMELNSEGSTPVFAEEGQSSPLCDSSEIVSRADEIGKGDVVLKREDPNWDKASEVISPMLGAMASLLKNDDESADGDLKKDLSEALSNLNSYLKSVSGPYLLGDKVSALDCDLAPKLKHISVAPKHYKSFEIPDDCKAVKEYLDRFLQLEEWKATSCPDDVIIWGWSKFFK